MAKLGTRHVRLALALAAATVALSGACGTEEIPFPPISTGVHAGGSGGSLTVSSSSSSGGDPDVCTPPCNGANLVCSHGVCVLRDPCASDDDCSNDTTCLPMTGCVPWGLQVPAHDPGCVAPGAIDGGTDDAGSDGGGAPAAGDCTAGPATQFVCTVTGAGLSAPICNRGAAPIDAGIAVGFYDGGTKACGAVTTKQLAPEECEVVTCTWPSPPKLQTQAVNLDVIANDGGAYPECKSGNDRGIVFQVYCKPMG